ncbi:MAG: hypothetical protein LQ350_001708 [Teloschistes chrysophthalmus]|nr:MAG: hypothetical protein LQ350_001708 [Niorma chrysophthalma]
MGGQGMHRITFNDEGGWAFTLIAEKSTCMSTEIWSTITKNVGNLAPLQVDPKTARVGSKEELLKSPVADSEAEDDTALNHASPMSYTSSNTSSFHDHAFESNWSPTTVNVFDFLVSDHARPDDRQVEELVSLMRQILLHKDKTFIVHCHGGMVWALTRKPSSAFLSF